MVHQAAARFSLLLPPSCPFVPFVDNLFCYPDTHGPADRLRCGLMPSLPTVAIVGRPNVGKSSLPQRRRRQADQHRPGHARRHPRPGVDPAPAGRPISGAGRHRRVRPRRRRRPDRPHQPPDRDRHGPGRPGPVRRRLPRRADQRRRDDRHAAADQGDQDGAGGEQGRRADGRTPPWGTSPGSGWGRRSASPRCPAGTSIWCTTPSARTWTCPTPRRRCPRRPCTWRSSASGTRARARW